MKLDAQTILILVAGLMAILGIIKPQWPMVAVGVLLLAVAMLIGKA